jgi:hypothetical protein
MKKKDLNEHYVEYDDLEYEYNNHNGGFEPEEHPNPN